MPYILFVACSVFENKRLGQFNFSLSIYIYVKFNFKLKVILIKFLIIFFEWLLQEPKGDYTNYYIIKQSCIIKGKFNRICIK